jgi:GTP-binding protein
MALIDELVLTATAGRGGNGVVRWVREKSREFGGPGGGDGGKGGDVYIKGVRDIGRLAKYMHDTGFKAENGAPGAGLNRHGKNGEDCIIELPIGSYVRSSLDDRAYDILNEEPILILRGGIGGLGNTHFKSSINRSPEEATPGKDGEKARLHVELRLIADAGLIGLPNAGKSSLLNAVTNAQAKVGDYPFTTLDPNLGALYGFVLADIPGLIEGASEGKGLGQKFLRHISRTKILLHCVSVENEDMTHVHDVVRTELNQFSSDVGAKREIVILTKTDTCTPEELQTKITEAQKWGAPVIPVSIYDDASLKLFSDTVVALLRNE